MIMLGNTLKRLRIAKDLTLSDLSDLSGVQIATLSRMENNKMTGTVSSHIELAKVLGISLSEFYQEFEKDKLSRDDSNVALCDCQADSFK